MKSLNDLSGAIRMLKNLSVDPSGLGGGCQY